MEEGGYFSIKLCEVQKDVADDRGWLVHSTSYAEQSRDASQHGACGTAGDLPGRILSIVADTPYSLIYVLTSAAQAIFSHVMLTRPMYLAIW